MGRKPSPTEKCDLLLVGLVQPLEFTFDVVALSAKVIVPIPCDQIGWAEFIICQPTARATIVHEPLLALDPEMEGEAMLDHEADFNALTIPVRGEWVVNERPPPAAWRIDLRHTLQNVQDE